MLQKDILWTWGIGLWILSVASLEAQDRYLEGKVRDDKDYPLLAAHVYLESLPAEGTSTDSTGYFQLKIPGHLLGDTVYLRISHIGYVSVRDPIYLPSFPRARRRLYRLKLAALDLEEVLIAPSERDWELPAAAHVEIKAEPLEDVPAISSDVSHALGLLPGVVANRGLSNAYAVRGGNYQENLFYIEGLPMYTPYLARSGQQEGLSVANVSLTESLSFAAGGWGANYGDKLSSMLDLRYKDPKRSTGGLSLGLLGAEAYLGTKHPQRPWRLLLGARYKDTRYVLRNLDTRGEYMPRFVDGQGLLRIGLSALPGRSELLLFGAYADNKYRLRPSTRESTFGTLYQQLHFSVAFQGEEVLAHHIAHAGMKWTQEIGKESYLTVLNASAFSYEREYFDIAAAYRLCDILPGGEEGIDACQTEVTQIHDFDYGRNFLQGRFSYSQADLNIHINEQHQLNAGLFMRYEDVEDQVDEYGLTLNAGYASLRFSYQSEEWLQRYLWGTFLQHTFYNISRTRWLTTGLRLNYSALNKEWLLSPRVQFSFLRYPQAPVLYKLAAGLYPQPPFYREMRSPQGGLYKHIQAQQSLHLLAGLEYTFSMWNRDFWLYVDSYYKNLYQLIPYEQENIRIRYYGDRRSRGYAYGVDTRLYGFFVPGQESWLSMSYLRTAEDIKGDEYSYINRPTDQRITLSLFFRDYFPNLPSWQVYTKMLFGTGLPFNPVGEPQYRNSFTGEAYYQLDIGFSKIFAGQQTSTFQKGLILSLELLNLLGSNQNISYSWIGLPEVGQFAVPSDFSARFVNLKLRLRL